MNYVASVLPVAIRILSVHLFSEILFITQKEIYSKFHNFPHNRSKQW